MCCLSRRLQPHVVILLFYLRVLFPVLSSQGLLRRPDLIQALASRRAEVTRPLHLPHLTFTIYSSSCVFCPFLTSLCPSVRFVNVLMGDLHGAERSTGCFSCEDRARHGCSQLGDPAWRAQPTRYRRRVGGDFSLLSFSQTLKKKRNACGSPSVSWQWKFKVFWWSVRFCAHYYPPPLTGGKAHPRLEEDLVSSARWRGFINTGRMDCQCNPPPPPPCYKKNPKRHACCTHSEDMHAPAWTHTHAQTHTHTHAVGHGQTDTHTHTHTHARCRERRWRGGGDFRAFTDRAGVKLSEPWTAQREHPPPLWAALCWLPHHWLTSSTSSNTQLSLFKDHKTLIHIYVFTFWSFVTMGDMFYLFLQPSCFFHLCEMTSTDHYLGNRCTKRNVFVPWLYRFVWYLAVWIISFNICVHAPSHLYTNLCSAASVCPRWTSHHLKSTCFLSWLFPEYK